MKIPLSVFLLPIPVPSPPEQINISVRSQLRSLSRKSSSSKGGEVTSEQCLHRCEAMVKVAGTEKSRARAFYRCRFWKDKSVDCCYFKWVDQLQSDGDASMVYELRMIEKGLA
ncbi:hypothetical protein LINGRAHAP2_LOCUS8149 [Linum grandiflorum]